MRNIPLAIAIVAHALFACGDSDDANARAGTRS